MMKFVSGDLSVELSEGIDWLESSLLKHGFSAIVVEEVVEEEKPKRTRRAAVKKEPISE